MSIDIIRNNFVEAQKVLNDFISDPEKFESIQKAGDLIVDSIENNHKVLTCGNGGSMCDSMHFAEEMTGRFRRNREALPAFSMADASHISCTANDYGFDAIFSRYVDSLGCKGDVLLALSTSGNSANILNAVEAARSKGIKVIGMTGKGGGKLASLCDVEIRVDHLGWSDRIQEIHIKVIHTLIDYVETQLGVGQEN